MTKEQDADDADVMRIWRECGLPEYFLGNGGSNHKLVAFAKACASRTPSPEGGEPAKEETPSGLELIRKIRRKYPGDTDVED